MKRFLCILFVAIACLAPGSSVPGLAQKAEPAGAQESRSVTTLQDLEKSALENNAALKQAEAAVRIAAGNLTQSGLYPNPRIGYSGDEISTGPVIRGGEHGFFLEQTIVLGGKLRHRRDLHAQALAQAESQVEVERQRVTNRVRLLYYEAMAVERRLEVRRQLAELAEEAVKTSHGLFNVGASDKPDVLEVEIEGRQEQLALASTRSDQVRVWQQLAAVTGTVQLAPSALAGDLERGIPALEPEATLQEILRASPVLKAARAGILRARSQVELARSNRVPDLSARGGLRYNRELLEAGGRPVGLEGFADISIELPLFNKNQGSIHSAAEEANFAEQEIRRSETLLRAQFAFRYDRYKTLLATVEAYRQEVLPRAEQAHQLYLARFKEMAAAYPQVLIARRAHLRATVEYLAALESLWKAIVPLQGYLVGEEPWLSSGQ